MPNTIFVCIVHAGASSFLGAFSRRSFTAQTGALLVLCMFDNPVILFSSCILLAGMLC